MARTARLASLVVATLVLGLPSLAPAQPAASPSPASPSQGTQPARPTGQGIVVLAVGPSRDEAFALARAIYGSRLRPHALDEVRARVLAGAPPPANASRELRELAEVRAGITGEDAAGRRLLSGLAQQVGAEALLVVRVERTPAPTPPPAPAGPPPATSDAGAPGAATDAGAAATATADAAAPEGSSATGNALPTTTVVARLFLADSGELDAARYSPEPGLEGAAAWRSTVTSLEARFPSVSRPVGAPAAALSATPANVRQEDDKGSPFYTSGWFWGAVGGAALLATAFYFASQDTSSDPIHLQVRVPK
jgi:hypothetical protein